MYSSENERIENYQVALATIYKDLRELTKKLGSKDKNEKRFNRTFPTRNSAHDASPIDVMNSCREEIDIIRRQIGLLQLTADDLEVYPRNYSPKRNRAEYDGNDPGDEHNPPKGDSSGAD